jgi:hypothetical protein
MFAWLVGAFLCVYVDVVVDFGCADWLIGMGLCWSVVFDWS